MKAFLKRLLLVMIGQLLIFEGVMQFSVHRREALTPTLFGFLVIGLIWALMGGFRASRHPAVWRFLAFAPLFVTVCAADYYYSRQIRPKLGFYQEPEWVEQQRGLKEIQATVEQNK